MLWNIASSWKQIFLCRDQTLPVQADFHTIFMADKFPVLGLIMNFGNDEQPVIGYNITF